MTYDFDLTVIGGGPGGYIAAIRAAQLGARVALIEKKDLGGTCLNRGCIPTKALISATGKLETIKQARTFGIEAEVKTIDFKKISRRKNDIVTQLRNGIVYLLKKNNITVFQEEASFIDDHTIRWSNGSITSEKFIIATGSVPKNLSLAKSNPRIVSSDELLELEVIPQNLAIIGGGVIGIEFAGIYNSLGTKVTIIEYCENILPNIDLEISTRVRKILSTKGIEIITNSKVVDVEDDRITISSRKDDSKNIVNADLILNATGRVAYLNNLGLEKIDVIYNAQGITVDNNLKTNQTHIAAIGDVLGGIQLAHLASAQGCKAVEILLTGKSEINTEVIPSCVYCSPELAAIGISEEEAISQGLEWEKAVFPLTACGKAVAMGETEGVVKVVFQPASGKLLGMHILSPHATDLIMECAIAMAKNISISEIGHIIHPHPTISESIMEVMHLAKKRPIHL